jgi:CDP-diacylglycerol--glycerol-3-phosphate 3-phosphatidyltransferase
MAKIFSVSARAALSFVVTPTARTLLRWGVSPNAVTVAGTVGVLFGALVFGARGYLMTGLVVVTLFALTDMLDGTMARMRGESSKFGALLDSTMDRIADGAVFGAVTFYLMTEGNPYHGVVSLVLGQGVWYVKARAEGLGMTADVGIAERAERLLLVGVGGILTSLGLPWGLPAALWLLAAVSLITVGQRIHAVHRQATP